MQMPVGGFAYIANRLGHLMTVGFQINAQKLMLHNRKLALEQAHIVEHRRV